MKLGILDAVPSEFLYVDEHISDGQKFVDLLTDANFDGEMVIYNVGDGQFPSSVKACDAYLITGSPLSVYENHLWISDLLDFIRASHAEQHPMVGVCFGHQAIAQALGGQVEAAPKGWLLGLKSFAIFGHPDWMQPKPSNCQIYHINQDQVILLPPDATHLGKSEGCPNSMYTIGDHIFCLQGHPEQPLRAMRNFIRELGDAVPNHIQAEAEESFQEGEPDRLMAAQWIRSFLESRTL